MVNPIMSQMKQKSASSTQFIIAICDDHKKHKGKSPPELVGSFVWSWDLGQDPITYYRAPQA